MIIFKSILTTFKASVIFEADAPCTISIFDQVKPVQICETHYRWVEHVPRRVTKLPHFWHEVVAMGCIFEEIILVWSPIGQPT